MNAENAMITLSDAREYLKAHVDGGTNNTAVIDARIAEAEVRLAPKLDVRGSLCKLRVLVRNRHFCLPRDIKRVIRIDVDGMPAHVFSPLHEFSMVGPGDLDMLAPMDVGKHIVDEGDHATQFDVPIPDATEDAWRRQYVGGYRLMAFSSVASDTSTPLTVRGLSYLNDELRTGTEPGIPVPINQWDRGVEGQITDLAKQGMSKEVVRNVQQVYKPVTRGTVTLFAVDRDTSALWLLSKMGPDETRPSYRRYKLTGVNVPSVSLDTSSNPVLTLDCASALLLVKRAWVRASRADDILYIQNLPALKLMCMAITHENAGRHAEAVAAESRAFQLLVEQKSDDEGESSTPLIIDMEPVLTGRTLYRSIR